VTAAKVKHPLAVKTGVAAGQVQLPDTAAKPAPVHVKQTVAEVHVRQPVGQDLHVVSKYWLDKQEVEVLVVEVLVTAGF
jgi:hypothetical protein